MKVILLEDVKTLGKKGQIIEVNDGYARNFVLPKKLGMEANNKNLNDLKLQKAKEVKIAKELLEHAQTFAKELSEKHVMVTMKAGEGGRVFGSISSKEIAKAALDQFQIELDKKKIVMEDHIKNFGTFQVGVKLHPQVTATLTVLVKEEK